MVDFLFDRIHADTMEVRRQCGAGEVVEHWRASEVARAASDLADAVRDLRAENARLREAAARLEMVKRYIDVTAGLRDRRWSDVINILDGTTPIPPDLEVLRG